MNDNTAVRPEKFFLLAGLFSALITLALGAFWLMVLILGTGFIFSITLLITDSLLQRHDPTFAHAPFSQRMIAATIVAVSYPCGIVVFVAVGSYLDQVAIGFRNFLGLVAASVVSSLTFYWALTLISKVKRGALFWLFAIGLSSALVSGSSPLWGKSLLVLKPPLFISPAWFALLIIGEMGYAWVWGKSQVSAEPRGV